jgi:hypothetical protein
MIDRATLLALAERCDLASEADRVLDAEITKSFIPRDATHVARSRYGWSFTIAQEFEWLQNQPYTSSLDAASMLYPERPDLIPSCPRKASAAALRAMAAAHD